MEQAKLMVFEGQDIPMHLQEQSIPELNKGEILIKNLYTSICGSDLHTYCGLRKEKVPTVLGHEIVGEIIAFAKDHNQLDYVGNKLNIGNRVTWSIFSSDKASAMSMAGMPQKGEGLFKYGHAQVTATDALHGGLSTHCILKDGTAVMPVFTQVPLPIAAIINCAIATVSGAVRLAGNLENKIIIITGCGLLGMACAAMCKLKGARYIHMVDVDSNRLKQASHFGADQLHLVKGNSNDIPADVDVAFDMSGSADAMEQGLHSLAIGGTAVWVGAVFNTRKVQIDAESVVRRLIKIKGLHNYNFEDFVSAVNFINNNFNSFPFEQVVAKEYSLANTNDAFEYAVKFKPLRVGINHQMQ